MRIRPAINACVILVFLLAIAPRDAGASLANEEWTATWSSAVGGREDWYASCTDLTGNTYLLLGLGWENRLVKYNRLGTEQYAVTAGVGAVLSDLVTPRSLFADPSGNVYATGTYQGEDRDVYVAKYDSTGSLMWAHTYDTGLDDAGVAVTADSAGNVFVAGYSENFKGVNHALLLKYDAAGTAQWALATDLGSGYERGYGVVADPAGNAYLAGPAEIFGYPAMKRTFVRKYSAGGGVVYSRTFTAAGGPGEYARAVAFGQGDYSGTLYVAADSGADLCVLAVEAATGNEIGTGSYTFGSNVMTGGIAVDASASVYVAGSMTGVTTMDMKLVKFDPGLAVIPGWPVSYDSGGKDGDGFPAAGIRLGVDPAGTVYMSGREESDACGTVKASVVLRYEPGSALVATRKYDAKAESDFDEVAAGAGGEAYAGGNVGGEAVLVKYTAAGGKEWERNPVWAGLCGPQLGGVAHAQGYTYVSADVFNAVTNTTELKIAKFDAAGAQTSFASFDKIRDLYAGPLAVDSAGAVYLVAPFVSSTGVVEQNLLLMKYGPTGTLAWSRVDNFAWKDQPASIAVDDAGVNVLEPYRNDGLWGDGRFLVARYDFDGNLIWSRTAGGGATADNWPVAGAIRAGPNGIYFCGSRLDRALHATGYLAALDRSGNLMWESEQSAGGDARLLGLALDPGGKLLVTGAAGDMAADRWDLYTLSCDSAGAVRWTRRRDFGATNEVGRGAAGSPLYVSGSSGRDAVIVKYAESPGPDAELSTGSVPLKIRRPATAVLRITDTGGSGLSGVTPVLTILSGTVYLTVASAPTPATADVSASGTASFTWSLSVSGVGTAVLSATATGRITGTVDIATALATATVTTVRAYPDFGGRMMVFPNPATGDVLNVAIKLDADASEITVEMYDTGYRRVYRGVRYGVAAADGQVTIPGMNALAPGVYLLRAKARLAGGKTVGYDPVKVVVK
jgi:hypothetical protein